LPADQPDGYRVTPFSKGRPIRYRLQRQGKCGYRSARRPQTAHIGMDHKTNDTGMHFEKQGDEQPTQMRK